jgi:MFS family permease
VIAFITLAASDNNYALVALVAAGFSLLSILLTYFWLPETHPPEKRGLAASKPEFGLTAMLKALRKPEIGVLLVLMFTQQFAFGGYEQMLSLFTLNRLGMNASNNSAFFVYIGIIVVAVQGYFVGKWSRRFGDRWVILLGLVLLAIGLTFTAITPSQAVPWYSQSSLLEELTLDKSQDSQITSVEELNIGLPDESNTGWLGLIWLLAATIPVSIGGGILQPSINSMLTKNVIDDDIGGTLGLSSAFYSGANALTPIILGFIFDNLGATYPFLIGGIILFILWLAANKGIAKRAP